METDTINYMKYKMDYSQKILLADDAVPTKFHCQEDTEYVNIQPVVTVKKEVNISHPMPVVSVIPVSDSLESADCVRVKTEPLWDLSTSREPETAGPIEGVVKLEQDSDSNKASWGLTAYEPQTDEPIEREVKIEGCDDGDKATWELTVCKTVTVEPIEHVMKIEGCDDGEKATWELTACETETAGPIELEVKMEQCDDGDQTSWDVKGFMGPEAQAGHIDHIVKAEGCDSEEGDQLNLLGLYNDHKVKEKVVLGPEEFQQPKATLVCQEGGLLSNQTFSVRLERMQVDMQSHICSIGRNTYKFRQYFPSDEDYSTHGESSTNNKLDRQTQHINDPDHPGTKSSRNPLIHQKQLLEKPYKCAYCSYARNDEINLRKHEKTHKTIHTDKNCGKTTHYKHNLKIQESTHTGDAPFKCAHCTYTTPYKRYLKYHHSVHTGEKPYKCNYCSYAARSKKYLRSHEKIHNSKKPYKCAYCSHTSTQSSNLKQHERIHTGEKPYKCKHCSYASTHSFNLTIHERIHTGDRPYKCTCCSYASVSRSDLKRHVNTHTKRDN